MTRQNEEGMAITELPFCFRDAGHELPLLGSAAICVHDYSRQEDLKVIAGDLRRLFNSSFTNAVRTIFDRTARRLHDEVLRAVLVDLLNEKNRPIVLDVAVRTKATEQLVSRELSRRTGPILAQLALQLAMDDVFDIVCDLAVTHGRDILIQGPPCACFFTRCLDCLNALVDCVETMPPIVEEAGNVCECCNDDTTEIGHTACRDHERQPAVGTSKQAIPTAASLFADAWDGLTKMYWMAKQELDPMEMADVARMLSKTKKVNGIALWHAIAAANLDRSEYGNKGKGRAKSQRSHLPDVENSDGLEKLRLKQFSLETEKDKDYIAICEHSRKALADTCRTRGNKCYSTAQYPDALLHYTRAIEYDSMSAVYYLNRAACYLKLGQLCDAERDCTASIKLDRNNAKSFYRRGVSRARQGNIEAAVKDFREVLIIHKESEPKVYTEFKKLSEDSLREAMEKRAAANKRGKKVAAIRLPSQRELTMEGKHSKSGIWVKRVGKGGGEVARLSKGVEETLKEISVEDVFEQVSFAVAFSHILRRRTGVCVSIPLQRRRIQG